MQVQCAYFLKDTQENDMKISKKNLLNVCLKNEFIINFPQRKLYALMALLLNILCLKDWGGGGRCAKVNTP